MPPASTRPRLHVRRRRLWIVLVVGACLVGFLYYRPVKSYLQTSHQLSQRKAEVHALAGQKDALARRLALSGTGEARIEEARRLGYVRPGERLFIVRGIKGWLQAHAQTAH